MDAKMLQAVDDALQQDRAEHGDYPSAYLEVMKHAGDLGRALNQLAVSSDPEQTREAQETIYTLAMMVGIKALRLAWEGDLFLGYEPPEGYKPPH